MAEFAPDEIDAAVEWHLREFVGAEFFISRLGLVRAATVARDSILPGRCA